MDVDVIVIGAGPAGENVAGRVVRGGLTCAVVEDHLAGGECSYYACIPSKALLRPMELADEVGRVPGLPATEPVDVAAVLARRDEAVSHLDDSGQVEWITKLPAEFVRGRGTVVEPKVVEVTGQDGRVTRLTARHAVVVATGSVPVVPPVPGLAEARPWGSREATTVKQVPRRLVVIGGGVVACEMAQALHFLGASEVTMLVRDDRLLGRVEPFAGELLAESLRSAGIDVRFGASAERVERTAEHVVAHLAGGGTIEADEILVATGRHPALEGLGVDSAEVDDSMRVKGSDWLYAVGDVNGRSLLTHMGKYQARVCGDVIVARAKGEPDDGPALRATAPVPQVVFTDPQICSVGRTEEAARAEGFDIRVVEYDLGNVSGAYLLGDGYTGRAKAIVDERRKVLLGVTFAGPGVAELLHAATIAVTAEVPLEVLWHAVPAFPTVSEVWLRLLEEYGL
ncbi:dihydrolipoyl dehydrogenase family protein [Nonomuraea soli]|uniref:Dihydrolipoamide dehydrogenase n=1 Tax=Nonomuraea soli TaxID=1032476 RepID=A0A7W0CMV7_9ACTN|nr:NAD(P)/FAD-dependent oxidoreductase [Nonomuraea soli]MBA2893885.1 dihydrolipoamide dehydrogenase [Nonomuraea soli]